MSIATRERVRAAWPQAMLEIASGELVRDAMKRAGISDDIKRAYLATEPGARKQWDEARECSADSFYDEAVEVARKRSTGNDESPDDPRTRMDANDRRLLVDTLKWAARIRNPRLYSDKQTVDLNVRTVDLTAIIRDANARLAQARAPALIEHSTGKVIEDAALSAMLGSIDLAPVQPSDASST